MPGLTKEDQSTSTPPRAILMAMYYLNYERPHTEARLRRRAT